ncbi:MAG: DNA polymerase I [Spirochaetaceae bacterium]|nr:DNA polymerase I [Spirochaetaceae bacterium]
MKPKLFLLDAFSLIFRSYWAFIHNPVRNPEGQNISAVYGFLSTVLSLLDKHKPESFAVVMDSPVATFRHDMYPEYKANREKAPDDLHDQIPIIKEFLEALGLKILISEGYEADDLMACAARKGSLEGFQSYIISTDKDLMQTITTDIHMLRPEKGEYIDIGPDQVVEKMGVRSDQIVDYLSLIGDSADNIPGVRGIGPKTAVTLLQKFDTLDGIYANIDSCTKGQIQKLSDNRENAYFSKKLIVLNYEKENDIIVRDYSLKKLDLSTIIPLLQKHGMTRLVSRVQKFSGSKPLDNEAHSKAGSSKGVYSTIFTLKKLDEWILLVKKNKWFAMDIETDNIDPMKASPVGFSLSVSSGRACYIPLFADGQTYLQEDEVKKRIVDITSDKELKLIGHNFKYDYKVLRKWGVKVENLFFDTMVAAWILDTGSNSYSMDVLAENILSYSTIKYKDIVPKDSSFPEISLEIAAPYAAEDADITFRFFELFRTNINNRKLEKIFYEMEMPLVSVLAEIEFNGIKLETSNLDRYSLDLNEKLARLVDEIYIECGREFNINSPKQLQEILFKERKLQPVKKTKTGYSTDSSVLEILSREDVVPDMILKYRTLMKLKSTYVDALPNYVNQETGRIHTNLRQTGTATGRLSSRDPNLQNIPVKSEEGRKIREAFVASEGCSLLSADYSQIELVVLAHLSGDAALKKAFVSGNDVHSETGALIFDKPLEAVTKDDRRIAKTINFGVMYGMSSFRLGRDLGIQRSKAEEFIKSYFSRYNGIRSFMDSVIAEAEKTGRVKTFMGRERFISGINSRNKTEKSGAERMAINTPIQGSAADIVKMAMIQLAASLKEKKLKSRMILQVHDELIFEVPDSELELMKKLVRDKMENVVTLSIPLRTSIETGKNWGDFH